MIQSEHAVEREGAFRLFAECPKLAMESETEAAINAFICAMMDSSIDVSILPVF